MKSIAYLIVGLLSLAGAWYSIPAPLPRPPLEASQNPVQLGELSVGTTVQFEFSIRNTGESPLRVTGVHADCSCTVLTKPQETLAPGHRCVIRGVLDVQTGGPIHRQVDVLYRPENGPDTRWITVSLEGFAVDSAAAKSH